MGELRLAGADLGLDIREGLGRFDLDEMRRAFRRDKLIPRSLMAPDTRLMGLGGKTVLASALQDTSPPCLRPFLP